MPFYLYERSQQVGRACFRRPKKIALGGQQAIYQLWLRRERQGEGWEVSADELIQQVTGDINAGRQTHGIIIDLVPSSKSSIIFLELLHVWLYTYKKPDSEEVEWTPLMLKLRDVYAREERHDLPAGEKEKAVSSFVAAPNEDPRYADESFEFLYLQGHAKGWNWGRVGQVNGAILHKPAREYFARFFCPGGAPARPQGQG